MTFQPLHVHTVLEMYSKLQDLMQEKQFYSALKTLEQLEHIHLPRVRGYIFSEALAKEIPNVRLSIENQSKAELKVGNSYRGCIGYCTIMCSCIVGTCVHVVVTFVSFCF